MQTDTCGCTVNRSFILPVLAGVKILDILGSRGLCAVPPAVCACVCVRVHAGVSVFRLHGNRDNKLAFALRFYGNAH